MPVNKYNCTNFANCDAALSKEVIEIEDGEEVVCPTCKQPKTLAPLGSSGPAKGGRRKGLLVGGIVVVAAVMLVWMLWPSPPRPELASSMLTDFFTRLK
jgi:hypothetical protein